MNTFGPLPSRAPLGAILIACAVDLAFFGCGTGQGGQSGPEVGNGTPTSGGGNVANNVGKAGSFAQGGAAVAGRSEGQGSGNVAQSDPRNGGSSVGGTIGVGAGGASGSPTGGGSPNTGDLGHGEGKAGAGGNSTGAGAGMGKGGGAGKDGAGSLGTIEKDGGSKSGGTGGGTGQAGLACNSCHGSDKNPAPPADTLGNTETSSLGVGAHPSHLTSPAVWRRTLACQDCHKVPSTPQDPAVPTHMNGVDDVIWSSVAGTGTFSPADHTCTSVYCHGATLAANIAGATVTRTPVWTTVDGSQKQCGSACHSLPPGGTHPAGTGSCESCHGNVIASFNAANPSASTWTNAQLHIDGKVDVQATALTCTSCHGDTASGRQSPPLGVDQETATNTLAVGRHVAHLTAGNSHGAFQCSLCHVVPAAGDTAHAAQHVASSSLDTAGHHGDVTFSGVATGMTFNQNAAQGSPVSSRGTCTGTCHSNGRGGAPRVTPYWAGGNWTTGCTNCHGSTGSTGGEHGHGFPGSQCGDCHTGASSTTYTASTHRDGKTDFRANPGGRASGMTLGAGFRCSNVPCHQDHGGD